MAAFVVLVYIYKNRAIEEARLVGQFGAGIKRMGAEGLKSEVSAPAPK
jgi:hypothetical protein